jgi:hypothetical protein
LHFIILNILCFLLDKMLREELNEIKTGLRRQGEVIRYPIHGGTLSEYTVTLPSRPFQVTKGKYLVIVDGNINVAASWFGHFFLQRADTGARLSSVNWDCLRGVAPHGDHHYGDHHAIASYGAQAHSMEIVEIPETMEVRLNSYQRNTDKSEFNFVAVTLVRLYH